MNIAHRFWTEQEDIIKTLMLYGDIGNFLNWKIIQNTMYIPVADYVDDVEQMDVIQHTDMYDAIKKESVIGNGINTTRARAFSCNIVHQAYHFIQFEETTGKKIKDLDLIYEFGGGYGCMRKLAHDLGFSGTYIIYDLPVLSELQNWFLAQNGITDTILLNQSTKFIYPESGNESLFISCWALSETPVERRQHFLPVIDACKYFLIAYQSQFNEIDNVDYFLNIDVNKKVKNWMIEHLENNFYMIGE